MNRYPDTYYTLLTSLPAMPADWRQPHVPISRPRLEDRLAMLDDNTRELVELWLALLDFDTSEATSSEAARQEVYRKLALAMTDQPLRDLLDLLVDARDIVAALRERNQQRPPPPMLGGYAGHVRRNWRQPDFRLGRRFSWIADVHHFLTNGQIVQAENTLSRNIWHLLRRHGARHHFSLPALVVYLMQWHLVSRWSARDDNTGRQRFSTLLTGTLNGYHPTID